MYETFREVALVAVEAELRGVAKDSNNPEFRSAYVSNDAIIAASSGTGETRPRHRA
jgi:hypothetical protein